MKKNGYAYDFTNKLKAPMNELKIIPAGFERWNGLEIHYKTMVES